MGTKDKNGMINAVAKMAGEFDNDSVFFGMHINEKKQKLSVIFGGMDAETHATVTVASCLKTALEGDKDEGINKVAKMVIDAVRLVVRDGSEASAKLCASLQGDIAEGMNRFLYGEDDEDCENCDERDTCEMAPAVKYREYKDNEHDIDVN